MKFRVFALLFVCLLAGKSFAAAWQALFEDLASIIPAFGSNPLVNPFYPVDNFALAGAPLNGFVPFAFSGGLDYQNQPAHPLAGTIPDSRIIAPFNPATDF